MDQWVSASHQVAKHWSLNYRISASNEYSGLIFFRIYWFDLFALQGTIKSLFWHHNLKALTLQPSVVFIVQLSHLYMNTGQAKVKVKLLSRVRLLVTPWTAAYQAPPSMGFSSQQYWSGVPLPSPIWATFSSKFSFCRLYRVSPSLAANNIISLILVLTVWWYPCDGSGLVLLEEGVCYD